MNIATSLVVVLCLAEGLHASHKRYTGYKTYRVLPKTYKEIAEIEHFKNDSSFDFWTNTRIPKQNVDIMVAPKGQVKFERELNERNITFETLIPDVQKVVESERKMQRSSNGTLRFGRGITFNKYYRYSEIVAYLNEIQSNFPQLAKVERIGKTYEGRDHYLLKISSGGNGQKTAVFIDAGIHAREWAAPALALYIINQLVENYKVNQDLLVNLDWFIVPIANPDGYEYSHTKDRFWRKTRSIVKQGCVGADANRNYEYHWGEVGASSNPCSDTFRGTEPFSEVEARNMRDFELSHDRQINGYIALHSYGPYWLYPWGFTWDLPDDWQDLDDLGNAAASAIRAIRGSDYVVGSSTRVLYEAAGGSDDYAKGVVGAKYSYTVELVGGGSQGFDLPPNQIQNVVSEAWEGIKVFARQVAKT